LHGFRDEAQERALRNHPRISVANLRALGTKEVTREARSSFFPTLTANVTAASGADDNTRLAAGALNNPSVFPRNAEGLILSQLITDFGRTADLTASAKFRAKAEEENAEATQMRNSSRATDNPNCSTYQLGQVRALSVQFCRWGEVEELSASIVVEWAIRVSTRKNSARQPK
jgi:hypothetical protein